MSRKTTGHRTLVVSADASAWTVQSRDLQKNSNRSNWQPQSSTHDFGSPSRFYRVRQKNCPTLKRYIFLIFSSKNEIKILQESVFTLESRLLTFFTTVKYSLRNGTFSLTSQIASLFTNMAPLTVEDRRLISCLRVEKGWNAFQMMREFPMRKWKNVI